MSDTFKIIPVAYTNKSEMDNSILWNNKGTGGSSLITNIINEYGEKENTSFQFTKELDNTELNTEYFSLKGQYLILSQAPIPKNSRAYMEIEIYTHPRISDIRHLAISVGIHKNPVHGVLYDDFCMGNVFYTKPYTANALDSSVGTSYYSQYVVTERQGLNLYKIYDYIDPYATTTVTASSPPLLNDTIGIAIDLVSDYKIHIYVNGVYFYSFASQTFTLQSLNQEKEDSSPNYIKKINTSEFYFAMYTHLTNGEIEGLFNLGKDTLKYKPKEYMSLFDLYNINKTNTYKFLIKFNVENLFFGKPAQHKNPDEYTYIADIIPDENFNISPSAEFIIPKINNKREPSFTYNNMKYNYVYINTKTNKLLSNNEAATMLTVEETKDLIKEIYIGRNFYVDTETPPLENKGAFYFYNRKYPFIDMEILPSDFALLNFPIPVYQEIYFEFKCMYSFLNSDYEGLPLYIGLTNTFPQSNSDTLGIISSTDNMPDITLNEQNMLKIALFRQKASKTSSTGTGFKVYKYKNGEKIEIGVIHLSNPLLIEQGKSIGIRIDIKSRKIIIYNRDYEFGSVEIPEDLNFGYNIKPVNKRQRILYGKREIKTQKIVNVSETAFITDEIYENIVLTRDEKKSVSNGFTEKIYDSEYFQSITYNTLCYFFFEVEDVNVLKAKSNLSYVICNFGGDKNIKLVNKELLEDEDLNIMSLYQYYNTNIVEVELTPDEQIYRNNELFIIEFEILESIKSYEYYYKIDFKITNGITNTIADLNNLFNTDNIVTDNGIYNNYPNKSIYDLQHLITEDSSNKRD